MTCATCQPVVELTTGSWLHIRNLQLWCPGWRNVLQIHDATSSDPWNWACVMADIFILYVFFLCFFCSFFSMILMIFKKCWWLNDMDFGGFFFGVREKWRPGECGLLDRGVGKKHSFDIVAYLAPGIKVFIFRFYTMSPCFYQWFPAKHCTFPRLWNRCPGRADKSRSVAGAVDLFSWLFTPERKTLPGFGPNCARGAADNTYCMSEKLAGSDICLIISA